VTASTADIEQTLLDELRAIGVDTPQIVVREDDVEVRGLASTYEVKRRAARVVQDALPFHNLLNLVRVVPGAAESDERILALARQVIRDCLGDGSEALSVRVRKGVVKVEGLVPSLDCLCRISGMLWGLPGVRDVVVKLQVSATPAILEQQLGESITRILGLAPGSVRVRLQGCVATVEGNVRSEGQRTIAEDLLRWHAGVYDVVNRLQVAGDVAPGEPPKMTA
jgi:osmotically-inducible protein OsmY